MGGGRSWQPFSDSNNCHTNFRLSRVRYFSDKCIIFAHNCKLTNLIQCIMQNISCNSALHEQKNTVVDPKISFLPKIIKKVRKSRQILIAQQKSLLGIKIFVRI